GRNFSPDKEPSVTIHVSTKVPPQLAHFGKPVQWTYRIDSGFYHPWSTNERLTIKDPVFWLQGNHTIEVLTRIQGEPPTTDKTPRKLSVVIDTVPPKVRIVPTARGVRAEVYDAVTPSEKMELSWKIGDKAPTGFGNTKQIDVLPETPVEVIAKDSSGNISRSSAIAYPLGATENEGGCTMGGSPRPINILFPLLMILGFCRIRNRSRKL
ncbi:MAG: hypothetical protein V1754_04200, partial [Pseudomonadota bacterium]